ncbi:hypothetical protein [Aeromonas phage MJG]|uniref:Calcineurin-like phosphoesterase domain-containing protein n=1 Tax=Aeromonas phage MJG TaxID=2510451 RepID=A0A5J5ZZF9_9CAUD|nr:hypothetical protein [Aeromonas phage MJG]
MAKIRNLFTDEQVYSCREAARRGDATIDYRKMSELLYANFGEAIGVEVSPELCRYWAKQFDKTKKNGEHYLTLALANREIKKKRKVRKADKSDWDGELNKSKHKSILVIPDQHAPYVHPDALEFLIAVAAKYKPDTVINLGDETDHHALSYHDSDPDLDSAGVELTKARVFLGALERAFPKMRLCHSNHGSMLHRKAKTHGIPADMIRTYREVLFPDGAGQGWDWKFEHRLTLPNGDDVLFRHQASGDKLGAAAHERCNLVLGHEHGKFLIESASNGHNVYWAMQSGCLIDTESRAYAYGQLFKNKPVIGCSVIVDSLPQLVPMRLDSKGRWTGRL